LLDEWLEQKSRDGMSWATRSDLRNIVSGIFTTAERWGKWDGRNPARRVKIGRKRRARESKKLTVEQTRQLLAALPPDVRLIVMVALSCTLRISEILGLCWQHVDLDAGTLHVCQRFYRGDVDVPKSEEAVRIVPLGLLAAELRKLYPGQHASEDFVFSVKTCRGVTRDDRSIHQHFLRKAAKQLGLYWVGFGFHSFRREAITSLAEQSDAFQAMRLAGHSKMDMTLRYAIRDVERQDAAVRRVQEAYLTAGGLLQ
jgi:integrase